MSSAPGPRETADWRSRIRVAADGPEGWPTVRDLPISVAEVLQALSNGLSVDELLQRYPELHPEDIASCLAYGAELAGGRPLPPRTALSLREPTKRARSGWLARIDGWITGHQALALFYLMGACALVVHLVYYGLWRQRIFAVEGVTVWAAVFVVLPLVLVIVPAVGRASFWAFVITSLPAAAALFLWWRAGPPEWLTLLPALSAIFLMGTLVGLGVANWRALLFLYLPILTTLGILGWVVDRSVQPLIAGAGHGLMLGGVCRLVAWALQRELAGVALGTFAGAYGGLILADRYGLRVYAWLGDLGWHWRFQTVSLYAELLGAYVGAVAVALLSGFAAKRR